MSALPFADWTRQVQHDVEGALDAFLPAATQVPH